jgi:soluble lytic murein transglycosylase-like protein
MRIANPKRFVIFIVILLTLFMGIIVTLVQFIEPKLKAECIPTFTATPTSTPEVTIVVVYEPKMPEYDIPLSEELQKYLWDECQKRNVNYALAVSVIKNESSFNANCISKNSNGTKDYGLFQINSSNHKWISEVLKIDDYLDPKQNIRAGVWMLSWLKDKYKCYDKTLIGYNMGEGNIKKLASRGIETTRYSRRVIKGKQELEIKGGF